MKIKISFAVLLFLGLCSAVSINDTTAFGKTVSFEGGGLPTPCPLGYPKPTCSSQIPVVVQFQTIGQINVPIPIQIVIPSSRQ